MGQPPVPELLPRIPKVSTDAVTPIVIVLARGWPAAVGARGALPGAVLLAGDCAGTAHAPSNPTSPSTNAARTAATREHAGRPIASPSDIPGGPAPRGAPRPSASLDHGMVSRRMIGVKRSSEQIEKSTRGHDRTLFERT